MNDTRKYLTAIALAMFLCVFSSIVEAQQSVTRNDEPLPEEIANLAQNRQSQIERELSNLQNEWAGRYRANDDLTITISLSWSPTSGFMIWRESCSRPGIAQVNYGSVSFENNLLRLVPERNGNDRHTYSVSSPLVFVKWGEQHWLIPSDKLILFCYAINSESFEEIETFFVKVEDYEKPRNGLPDVPREYRRYLGREPIEARISAVGADTGRWYPPLTLSVGRAEGVVVGMKFYLNDPEKGHMRLEVTEVREHTSVARVVMAGLSEEHEKPEIGWRFSSRLPEGYL